MPGLDDIDRYVDEHDIPKEDWPDAFARWIAECTGGQVPRFEKVAPGNEQILDDREQRGRSLRGLGSARLFGSGSPLLALLLLRRTLAQAQRRS